MTWLDTEGTDMEVQAAKAEFRRRYGRDPEALSPDAQELLRIVGYSAAYSTADCSRLLRSNMQLFTAYDEQQQRAARFSFTRKTGE